MQTCHHTCNDPSYCHSCAALSLLSAWLTDILTQLQANEILFLSDSVQEIQAAIWAGMKAVVVDRPGNAPLETEYERSFPIMQALDGVGSAKPRFETPSLPYIDIGGTGQ